MPPSPVDSLSVRRAHVSFAEVFAGSAPELPTTEQMDLGSYVIARQSLSTEGQQLKALLGRLSCRLVKPHETRYITDLVESYDALLIDVSEELSQIADFDHILISNLKQAREYVDELFVVICHHVNTSFGRLLQEGKMLPRMSPKSLLSRIAENSPVKISLDWKKTLITYGIAITGLHRAERLLAAAGNPTELLSELQNPGHQDWNPLEHPDWLLLEIENRILIRKERVKIAREMIHPNTGSNSVMQLNMGLGKSSVIVPIVAAALADKTQLVRIIVLRPLVKEMLKLLVIKLGGMLNRRILYLPVSRALQLDVTRATQIFNLYKQCQRDGSILLLQPEHILSFELMGLEKILSGDPVGAVIAQTQYWLYQNTRDILDESDEILSVKFELVYTIGTQANIDFSHQRWSILQHVLRLLRDLADEVLMELPCGLEILRCGGVDDGRYPRLRILDAVAGDVLLEKAALAICNQGAPGFSTQSSLARLSCVY